MICNLKGGGMSGTILRASVAKLTNATHWTRAFLVFLAIGLLGIAVFTQHVAMESRFAAVGFALLFLHTASNSPAIVQPRLSFQKSAMSRLSRFLLTISETILTLSLGYFFVSRFSMWLA